MSALMQRAAAVAGELIEQRTEQSAALAELHATDPIVLRFVAAEAYVRGFQSGLDCAADCVRTEAEATRGELDDAAGDTSERDAGGQRVTIELGVDDAALLADFVEVHGQRAESTHGPLTLETLARMLLEDVALAIRRPGSWEGTNMATVLASHGYGGAA